VGEFWLTPGGGLGRGETFEAGALRELWEETGISGVELGPCVWTRTQVFPWDDKVYKQQERYFVVRVDEVEVHGDNWTEVEREVLVEHRW
jgi:8-oxo-dGTP pyrophosphatase MutT (NUDIX family)